jgi:hypothetical protein
MKKFLMITVWVLLTACSDGLHDQQNGADGNSSQKGATPCNGSADCAFLEECIQGLCATGSTDGSTDGTVTDAGIGDGSTDGTVTDAGSGDASIDGSTDGSIGDNADGGTSFTGLNLALTATATASEQWNDVWSPEKAIDGSMTTYWSTEDDLVSAVFTVTLTEAKFIDQVVINSGDYPMKTFSLQLSDDDVTYELIGEYDTEENVQKVIDFTAVNAKHIRLNNITADPGPAWTVAAIYEIEIYEAND